MHVGVLCLPSGHLLSVLQVMTFFSILHPLAYPTLSVRQLCYFWALLQSLKKQDIRRSLLAEGSAFIPSKNLPNNIHETPGVVIDGCRHVTALNKFAPLYTAYNMQCHTHNRSFKSMLIL